MSDSAVRAKRAHFPHPKELGAQAARSFLALRTQTPHLHAFPLRYLVTVSPTIDYKFLFDKLIFKGMDLRDALKTIKFKDNNFLGKK